MRGGATLLSCRAAADPDRKVPTSRNKTDLYGTERGVRGRKSNNRGRETTFQLLKSKNQPLISTSYPDPLKIAIASRDFPAVLSYSTLSTLSIRPILQLLTEDAKGRRRE